MKVKNQIIIKDWAGNILFEGDYRSKEVDKVLEANRCKHCSTLTEKENYYCEYCGDTGYEGDFSVMWRDNADKRNVYEFINY